MARNRSTLLLLALLAALGSPSARATLPAPAGSLADLLAGRGIQPVTPPAPAPDFTLPRLAGGEGDLSAHHGDWVVLTFFATWCGPCRHEMPTLERLHRERGADGLAVVAVSVDRRRATVEPFVERHGLTLPIFWDHRGEVGAAYRATSIPVSYLIDPTGRIVGMARGARDWAALGPLFDALREASPAPPDAASHYARLEKLALPEVLEPPTAEWALPAAAARPGRPFTLEVRLRWSGRLEEYLPQPPQVALPEGITRGRVAASSSSLEDRHLVRYEIELTAAQPGTYELDPIELRYLPALGDGPVAARVDGPTLEVEAAGVSAAGPAALVGLTAILGAAGLLFYRRRAAAAAGKESEAPPSERLRQQLDRAKRRRLAGEAGAGYELLVEIARELEAPEERRDLEQRLETVRFGGDLPDAAELEAIERRLDRALTRRQPDPDAAQRKRLRLRPQA